MNKVILAKKYSKKYHRGQIRKKDGSPYYMHPYSVVKILKNYGYKSEDVLCIAYLHDTLEDTELTYDEIKKVFGKYISKSVYTLSRNKGDINKTTGKISKKRYKDRILESNIDVQRVKIADMIHNTSTLNVLSVLSIEKKLIDSYEFYIPLGKHVSSDMIKKLEKNIKDYFNIDVSKRKYSKYFEEVLKLIEDTYKIKINNKFK
ncbi:MAG: HD domain-containing protein [Candidatus Woesearchaeota archaeon]